MFLLEAQGDGERTTPHHGKRIPPAISKLQRSSAGVNRHPAQAGTVCGFWEQTVTLLEATPFWGLTLVVLYFPDHAVLSHNVRPQLTSLVDGRCEVRSRMARMGY